MAISPQQKEIKSLFVFVLSFVQLHLLYLSHLSLSLPLSFSLPPLSPFISSPLSLVHRFSPSLHTPSASFPHLATPTPLWKVPQVSPLPPHFPSPPLVHSAASLEAQKLQLLASQTAAANSKMGHSKFIRRNQSDMTLLSDQRNQQLMQQTEEHTQPKNGLLVHQRSAPTFPLCNPFLFASTGGAGKLVSSAPFSSAPFSTAPVAVSGAERRTPPIATPWKIGERNSFETKKEEFIREAQEWSKQVSTKIKGSDSSGSSTTSRTDVESPPQPPTISSGLPLIPLNASSHLLPHSPPTTTPSSPSHKPFYFLPSPQTNGSIFGLSRGILAPQLSFLTSLSKISSPTSVHNGLLTTPTLSSDSKVVHVMQDGKVFAATSYHLDGEESESGRSNRSPKRVSSPSSDPEFTRSPKKRRRSSSLPDVNQLKSSLPSSPVSPSPVSTVTPVSGLPEHTFVSLMGGSGAVAGQAIPPIFFSNIPQATMGNGIKLESSSVEIDSEAKQTPPSPDIDVALHPGMPATACTC